MILQKYVDFRAAFALVGAPIVADGLPEWPAGKLHTLTPNFDSYEITAILEAPSPGFPIILSVNMFAADAVPGVDEYDFYLSQRTDNVAKQYLSVAPYLGSGHSGSVVIDVVSANVAKLLPGVTDYRDDATLKILLKNCHFYWQRRNDKAILWGHIYGGA